MDRLGQGLSGMTSSRRIVGKGGKLPGDDS